MEQVFAETVKAFIDAWMTNGRAGYINLIAIIAVTAQAVALVVRGRKRGE